MAIEKQAPEIADAVHKGKAEEEICAGDQVRHFFPRRIK